MRDRVDTLLWVLAVGLCVALPLALEQWGNALAGAGSLLVLWWLTRQRR